MLPSPRDFGLPHDEWRHNQYKMYQEAAQLHRNGGGFLFSELPTGCITGDTEVFIKKSGGNLAERVPIKFAYKQSLRKVYKNTTWATASLEETTNEIHWNQVDKIVYSGKKLVFELILKNGLSIKATSDHKIRTEQGYKELINLTPSDNVICAGIDSAYITTSTIDSIVRLSVQDTYDIMCHYPNHNFVANGIVIHNSGKSGIATALASGDDKVLVLVQTLGLLDQYERAYGFSILKGRQSYECVMPGKDNLWKGEHGLKPTAADCHYQKMSDCPVAEHCPYLIAKELAMNSKKMGCTYKYAALSRRVQERSGIVVLDEAHLSADEMLSFTEFMIGDDIRKKFNMPDFPFKSYGVNGKGDLLTRKARSEVLKWMYASLRIVGNIPMLDLMSPEGSRRKKMFEFIDKAREGLENSDQWFLQCGYQAVDNALLSYSDFKSQAVLRLRPLDATQVAKNLWTNKKTTVLMSATIGDPMPLALELGIDKFRAKSFPHPIPASDRPVFDLRMEKMTKANLDANPNLYKVQSLLIWNFIKKLPADWRGIILTSSYFKVEQLKKHLGEKMPDRIFQHSREARGVSQRINEFISNTDPGMISIDTIQGWGSGLDLHHDIARFSVVAGVPHANPSDRYEQVRMSSEAGKKYAMWTAYNSIPQAIGRVSRGETDDNGFVLNVGALADGSATIGTANRYLPSWFKEAIVPASQMQDMA